MTEESKGERRRQHSKPQAERLRAVQREPNGTPAAARCAGPPKTSCERRARAPAKSQRPPAPAATARPRPAGARTRSTRKRWRPSSRSVARPAGPPRPPRADAADVAAARDGRRRRLPPRPESAARAPLAPPAAGPAAAPPPAEAAAALTPLSALRLLSVCDSESGEGLFERVWRWPEGADPKGIGNLVRSFFLVARQLDHGMISRVVFEAPEDEAALVPHAGIGEAMEMLCTRNERVVVAVFHESRGAFADEDDEEAREVHVAMRQLVEQARELWSPDVSRADFKTTVDRLCARIVGLPPPPPDPRQPSPPPRPKSM